MATSIQLFRQMKFLNKRAKLTHYYYGQFFNLVDKSDNFASFLTVSRKFKYRCVHIFDIIYPEKST